MLDDGLTDQITSSNCAKESYYIFMVPQSLFILKSITIILAFWTIRILRTSAKIVDRLAVVQSMVVSLLLIVDITERIIVVFLASSHIFTCYIRSVMSYSSMLFILHNNTAMAFIRYLYTVFPLYMRGRNTTVMLRVTLFCLIITTVAKAAGHVIVPGRFLQICLKLPIKTPLWRVNTTLPCLIAGFYFYCHILYNLMYKRNFQNNQQNKTMVSALANFAVFVVIMAAVVAVTILISREKCSRFNNLSQYPIIIISAQTIMTLGYIVLSSEIRQRAWNDLRLISCIFCRWLKRRVKDRSQGSEASPELPNPDERSLTDTHTLHNVESIAAAGIPNTSSGTEAVMQTSSELSKKEIDRTSMDEPVHIHEKKHIVEGAAADEGNTSDVIVRSEANVLTSNVSIITTKALVSDVLPDTTKCLDTKRNAFTVHSTMPPVE